MRTDKTDHITGSRRQQQRVDANTRDERPTRTANTGTVDATAGNVDQQAALKTTSTAHNEQHTDHSIGQTAQHTDHTHTTYMYIQHTSNIH